MVSVIIPSYNSESTIKKCLEALINQTYAGTYEIILVDSSTDQTATIVQKRFPEVKLIKLQKKTDPGTGRNLGFKKSIGDPVLFIDSDCVAAPNWMERMVSGHNEQKYAAVGGGIQNGNPKKSKVAWAGYMAEFREFIPQQPLREVDHIPTCNISYKRSFLEKLGGFNSKYYPQEDLEFNFRVLQSGGKILFNPEIVVRHHHREQAGAFFRHQKIIGKITSKMLRILPLKGSGIARSKINFIVLLPILPLVKLMRTVAVFLKFYPKIFLISPLSTLIFAAGLFPWTIGFVQGVFEKYLLTEESDK